MNLKEQKNILDFLHKAEKLKTVLRHSWLSNSRRESVAEHTWRMALMAFLLHSGLDKNINLTKVFKIIAVHDLAEVYVPDFVAFRKQPENKSTLEAKSLKKLVKNLPEKLQKEIEGSWKEYEENKTLEAHFVKALDKLEVMLQHNESPIRTQTKPEIKLNLTHGVKHCEYDSLLKNFRELVKQETLTYYKKNKVDKKLYR